MSSFEFIARRKLISGHSEGNVYTLDQNMSVILPSAKDKVNPNIARDGTTETLFHRIDDLWSVTTTPMNDVANGEYASFLEMIHSVMDGQVFYFDPYGTTASPDNELRVIYEPGSYLPQRVNNVRGTSNPTWAVSFRMREV